MPYRVGSNYSCNTVVDVLAKPEKSTLTFKTYGLFCLHPPVIYSRGLRELDLVWWWRWWCICVCECVCGIEYVCL